MPSCPTCGTDVDVARTREGESIPLERNVTETTGSGRWAVVEYDGPNLLVEPVEPSVEREAHVDHRKDCPGFEDAADGRWRP